MARNLDPLLTSGRQDYETPDDFFAYVQENVAKTPLILDTCALPKNAKLENYYSLDNSQDGLSLPWLHGSWCNPPYSESRFWIKKGINEMQRNKVYSIFLIPARTDTRLFHDYIWEYASRILFIRGRISFWNEEETNSAPFPTMLVEFDPDSRDQEVDILNWLAEINMP